MVSVFEKVCTSGSDLNASTISNIINVGNVALTTDGHATLVANSLVGNTHGIAQGVQLYATTFDYANVESLITAGVKLMTCSMIANIPETDSKGKANSSYAYSDEDKWYDHLVSQHNVTFVQAAGNRGVYNEDTLVTITNAQGQPEQVWRRPRIGAPGLAYNVITVGAYDDKGTTSLSDDVLFDYSSWKNSYSDMKGCEKPDVVMPATYPGGGTSLATPVLTGIIALMLELKPSLAAYPQAIKSIVLASCHRKVSKAPQQTSQETMAEGITERQGAGAPDAFTMACIVTQGSYVMGKFSGSEDVRRFIQPKYGSASINVSLTWLVENQFPASQSHGSVSGLTLGTQHDIALLVTYGSSTVSASKSNSSTEMVYFTMPSTTSDYLVKAKKLQSTNTETVRFAYAWSTNNTYCSMPMADVVDEGIYYIKNKANDKYLNLNTSTNELNLQNYSNTSDTQKWIVQKSGTTHKMTSGYASTPGTVTTGATLSGTTLKAIINSSANNLQFVNNGEDGTFTIKASSKFLCYSGTAGAWVTSDPGDAGRWILEKINYRFGDANANGALAISDATDLQKHIAKTITFNNIQILFSDANRDGSVNIKDVTKIQKIVAKMDLF